MTAAEVPTISPDIISFQQNLSSRPDIMERCKIPRTRLMNPGDQVEGFATSKPTPVGRAFFRQLTELFLPALIEILACSTRWKDKDGA